MDIQKILIIADNIGKGAQISSMLPLTRFDDKINVVVCQEIESFESVCSPRLVILYTNKDNVLSSLKQIKESQIFKRSKVLLLLDETDNELLCSAYDIGIDSFLVGFDETTLFLTVIMMFRSYSYVSSSEQQTLMREVLIDENYLDPLQVYSYSKIFNTLNNYLEERKYDYNILMISPSPEAMENVSKHIISATLIGSIRNDDIPINISDKKFAVIFKTVDESRIKLFFEKLKVKFESLCSIYGVSAKIGNNLEFAVLYLQKILDENMKSGQEYSYFDDLSDVKYLGDYTSESSANDYMQSKNKFWKSFSELVTPYFFRTKTVMESRFPDAEISDWINEEETAFAISQDSVCAEIKITYPAFSRVNVVLSYERNGETKSHKEFYETDEFKESVLDELFTELFEGFEILIHSENNE